MTALTPVRPAMSVSFPAASHSLVVRPTRDIEQGSREPRTNGQSVSLSTASHSLLVGPTRDIETGLP